MNTHTKLLTTTKLSFQLDRISICFDDDNPDHVAGTVGLLLSEAYAKQLPGSKINSNARYKASASIPVPFMTPAVQRHPIQFEAGPRKPGIPSYRLDCNPAKLSPQGLMELMNFLDMTIDPTPLEFFALGRVTRLDVKLDIGGYTLDEVIVLTTKKRKHGVYSDQHGYPETAYLGSPRSPRLVAYNKLDKATGQHLLRLEQRLKPRCQGLMIAGLKNPFSHVQLLSAAVLDGLVTGVPGQVIADSIRVRGLNHALKIFHAHTCKVIRNALDVSSSLLPDSEALWAGWPQALIDLGLGEELGAIPVNWKPDALQTATSINPITPPVAKEKEHGADNKAG